jgi:RNA polymerase sigma-70 factor (ECF subfamily)
MKIHDKEVPGQTAPNLTDKAAFKAFFDQYYPKLIHFALVYLPTYQSAEEVVSDVLYKLLKNPAGLANVQNLNNYLFLAVRNQSFTYLKKQHHLTAEPAEDRDDFIHPAEVDPERLMIDRELYDIVQNAVEKLPTRRRAIFMLVKEEGMKYREVAELLEVSVKTIELHMSLALKEIREAVSTYMHSRDIKVKPIREVRLKSFLFFL